MSSSTSPISALDLINLLNNYTKSATPMSSFDLNTYLLSTVLNEENNNPAVYDNSNLINMLANTYNQIALNAMNLSNEPGVLNKSNAVATVNPSSLIQKTYGSQSSTLLNQAKSVATKISTGYEGAQVTGNFDGQGLSLGYLQWNIGSGTLQPLLKQMISSNPGDFNKIFSSTVSTKDNNGNVINQKMSEVLKNILKSSKDEQLSWAKSINDNSNNIKEPWKSAFDSLTKNQTFLQIENLNSKSYQNTATNIMKEMGVCTVRGYALAYDIAVQNGSVKPKAKQLVNEVEAGQINKLINPNDSSLTYNQRSVVKDLINRIKNVSDDNIKKLYYTAAAVAITSNDRFAKDVWARKSAIVAGQGTVHGQQVALNQVGLNDSIVV